jgi:hypothetical protein
MFTCVRSTRHLAAQSVDGVVCVLAALPMAFVEIEDGALYRSLGVGALFLKRLEECANRFQ